MPDNSAAHELDRQPRLEQVLADYLHSVEQGQPLDRSALVTAHPDLAGELQAFFRNHDSINRLAVPIKVAAEAPTITGPSESGTVQTGATVCYFGDYELITEIARGGMGVVYKARQVNLNRIVALKMILAGQLANDSDVKRFYAEAEAAAKLDHPGIVPIFEIGQHDGQHYFSMAFVEGESLAKKVANGPLPPREAAALVQTIAEAVEYAHQKGIIHRDLKPANVLLDKSGQPRVTDFGLAKQLKGDSGLTGTGQILGTPSYMPPEQAAGKIDQVGSQSDVYALGAILYCLLTGRPPFQAASPMETLMQVLDQEPVSVRQLNPQVPIDLETIALKCLEKKPARRFAKAADLVDELSRFLRGEPILARPLGRVERAAKWVKRNPVVAAFVLVSGLAALVLTGGGWWYNARLRVALGRAEDNFQLARRHLYAAEISNGQKAWETGDTSRLIEMLDANRPGTGAEDLRGFEWYYLWWLCHRSRATLRGHDGTVVSLAFTPDGRTLMSADGGGSVHFWDASTGAGQSSLKDGDVLGGLQYDAVLSADGRRLLTRADWGSSLWDPTRQQRLLHLTHRDDALPHNEKKPEGVVALSRDGKLLAAANGPTVNLFDAATGHEWKSLKGHTQPITSLRFTPDGRRLLSVTKPGNMLNPEAKLWDVGTYREVVSSPPEWADSIAVSPDGQTLVTSRHGMLRLWELETGRLRASLPGTFHSVVYSSDGKTLAAWDGLLKRIQAPNATSMAFMAGAEEPTVILWDTSTEQVRAVLTGHSRWVNAVAFAPDGKSVATAGEDLSAKLWDATTGRLLCTFWGHTDGVSALAFAPDGRTLASGSHDATVRFWDLNRDVEPDTLAVQDGPIRDVAFVFDSKILAVVAGPEAPLGRPGEVQLWDTDRGTLRASLQGRFGPVLCAAVSPDGSTLAFCAWQVAGENGFENVIKLWDMSANRERATLGERNRLYCCIAISPDGQTVAASDGGQVSQWGITTGQEQAATRIHVDSLAFAPNGNTLAGTNWTSVYSSETATGKQLTLLKTLYEGSSTGSRSPSQGHATLAFSPDGKLLAVACLTGPLQEPRAVQVLDSATGQVRAIIKGHKAPIWAVAFAPDGRTVATGSDDRTVKLWDPLTGQERLTLVGPAQQVSSLAFSRDGRLLAAGSLDGKVYLWRAATEAEVTAQSK